MPPHRFVAGAGLVLLVAGFTAAVVAGLRAGGDNTTATAPTAERPAAPTKQPSEPKQVPVPLRGLRGYDPEGDGREGDETAPLATDGEQATSWQTERYTSFFKDGVGLLLDADAPVTITSVVVWTETPGITASVRVGPSPDGPFTSVTPTKPLTARTTFAPKERKARYLVVWIGDIPDGGTGHVNEVRAFRAAAPG